MRLVLAAAGRRRRTLPLPLAGLRAALRAEETLAGPTSLLTWDEAQLLAVEMLSATRHRDAESLGVTPAAGWRRSLGAPTGGAASSCAASCSSTFLVERPADDLHAGRQPVAPEADRAREIAGWPVTLNSDV